MQFGVDLARRLHVLLRVVEPAAMHSPQSPVNALF